jgi:phospholipid/cholesterol/gamma-HCH transport system substrate-binding protein
MGKQTSKNIKVGIMVIAGFAILLGALYIVGSQKNMFGSGFIISSTFRDVGGLIPGNNVRFAGINVGTVKEVTIVNDSVVNVDMVIQKNARQYIKKNALAKIGTDGLMGNKLLIIVNVPDPAAPVEEGDVLASVSSPGLDEIAGKLSGTADDVSAIVKNLRGLTDSDGFKELPDMMSGLGATVANLKDVSAKIKQSEALWNTLGDPKLSQQIRTSLSSVEKVTKDAELMASDLKLMVADVKSGKGAAGVLLADTESADDVKAFLENIKKVSEQLNVIGDNLQKVSSQLNSSDAVVGKLINDPQMGEDLGQTMKHVKNSTAQLEEHLKALKENFLFRKYYRRKEAAAQE